MGNKLIKFKKNLMYIKTNPNPSYKFLPYVRFSNKEISKFHNKTKVYAEKTGASFEVDQVVKDVADRWERLPNKTSVISYGVGCFVLLWLASTIVGAVDNIPLLPKLLELLGLSYFIWFTYRYLIFKSSRQELVQDIEELKKKVSGDQ